MPGPNNAVQYRHPTPILAWCSTKVQARHPKSATLAISAHTRHHHLTTVGWPLPGTIPMLLLRPEQVCGPFAMPATTKNCQSPRHQHTSPILGYTSRQSNNPWSSKSSQSTAGHHHGSRCLSLPCYYGAFALPNPLHPYPLLWLSTARQFQLVLLPMQCTVVWRCSTPKARSRYAAATVQPVPDIRPAPKAGLHPSQT